MFTELLLAAGIGFVSVFTPCTLPLLPVYADVLMGYSKSQLSRLLIYFPGVFIAIFLVSWQLKLVTAHVIFIAMIIMACWIAMQAYLQLFPSPGFQKRISSPLLFSLVVSGVGSPCSVPLISLFFIDVILQPTVLSGVSLILFSVSRIATLASCTLLVKRMSMDVGKKVLPYISYLRFAMLMFSLVFILHMLEHTPYSILPGSISWLHVFD